MSESSEGSLPKDADVQPKSADREQVQKEKLINPEKAGFHMAIIANCLRPGVDAFPSKEKLDELRKKSAKESSEAPDSSVLDDACNNDSDNEWKKSRISRDKQESIWIDKTNEFLGIYKKNSPEGEEKPEAVILGKLGIKVDGGAKDSREEFVIANKRRIGYFAKKVADNLSSEEIVGNRELLKGVAARFYGEKFSMVVVDLAIAAKNMQDAPDEFIAESEKQFKLGANMAGADLIAEIHRDSNDWKVKAAKQKEDEERKAAEEAARIREEAARREEEEAEERKKKAEAESVDKQGAGTQAEGGAVRKGIAEGADVEEMKRMVLKAADNNDASYIQELVNEAGDFAKIELTSKGAKTINTILNREVKVNQELFLENAKFFSGQEDDGLIVVGAGSDFDTLKSVLEECKFYENMKSGGKTFQLVQFPNSGKPDDQVSRAVWELRRMFPYNVFITQPISEMKKAA